MTIPRSSTESYSAVFSCGDVLYYAHINATELCSFHWIEKGTKILKYMKPNIFWSEIAL